MSNSPAILFDPAVLPSALETNDVDTLASFYEMFILVTRDSWQQLTNSTSRLDLAKVRSAAHKLKSSSASIGAMQLTEALQALECLATETMAGDGQIQDIGERIAQTELLVTASVKVVQAHIDSLRPR